MKNRILFLFLAMAMTNAIFSQELVWSYSVENTGSTSRVTLYAQRSIAGVENVYAFNYGFYYKNTEATIIGVAPAFTGSLTTNQYNAAVDDSAAENDLGWLTDGTGAIQNVATPPFPLPPSSGYNRLFVGQLTDGNFEGEDIGPTPVAFLDLIFDVSVGSGPPDQDSVYMADFLNSNAFTYSELPGFGEFPVEIIGLRLQPLPIELISFKAKKFNERHSHLTWSTASEINSSHFLVQRSFDKKTWSTIGTVAAAGNSQLINNYEFVDENVYNGIDSRLSVYYRLQIFDMDGRFEFSPMDNVIFGNDASTGREIVVYPNPTSEGVKVEWDATREDQPTLLEFYDVTGKLILTQTVSENSNQEYVDFRKANMQSGLYLLRIMNGTEPIEQKQIVVGHNR